MATSSYVPSAEILRFCRQYLQLEASPKLPEGDSLHEDEAQEYLYNKLFSPKTVPHLPPRRYQLRILKELVSLIESSIDDWDTYGISDDLVTSLSDLLSVPLPPELMEAQQRSYVTYHHSALDRNVAPDSVHEAPITLLESRAIIAAGGTTGLRTWDSSLHLGQYLCKNPSIIHGKRLLELGAGTGYLSILCAKYLGAEHVVASDGSDDVINNLPDSLFLNGLQGSDRVVPMDLKWGHALVGTEEKEWNGGRGIDLVIGADITYDDRIIPPLVGTLGELSSLHPDVEILISAAERNIRTYEKFVEACQRAGYQVNNVDFAITPKDEQMGPFYEDRIPIHICKLSRKKEHSNAHDRRKGHLAVVWE